MSIQLKTFMKTIILLLLTASILTLAQTPIPVIGPGYFLSWEDSAPAQPNRTSFDVQVWRVGESNVYSTSVHSIIVTGAPPTQFKFEAPFAMFMVGRSNGLHQLRIFKAGLVDVPNEPSATYSFDWRTLVYSAPPSTSGARTDRRRGLQR